MTRGKSPIMFLCKKNFSLFYTYIVIDTSCSRLVATEPLVYIISSRMGTKICKYLLSNSLTWPDCIITDRHADTNVSQAVICR